MSSRSNAISTSHRPHGHAARSRRLVLCVRNDGYPASLEPRKFYLALRDRDAESRAQLRVIDESGEDYLFPASLFACVDLPASIRRRLLATI